MAKTIQVNLLFNANVLDAKRLMAELLQSLNQLITNLPTTLLSLTPLLLAAKQSAMDLKIALNNAMDVNTGKLNLNKFQSELQRSGQTIQSLAANMRALGPDGVRAFLQVSLAVALADTKMFNLTAGARKLVNTFANTLRWQITSGAIHGVMSAIRGTIDYAKELDTSLNSIQRVTKLSTEEMSKFAKEANIAAKELGTTTTKYTDASLIYYRLGLSSRDVKERTDVTVKLANVVGKSAQEVSEWLTAIWNNYDNGSKSLEYYADVLTKLGASTASSADEIATGLEKFSAVADTVGLSFDYAASALATVTAETRQSAEVVGTAFKTLFARIENLKLGDTLEDGTNLSLYSLALEKVGVNIKDSNNELKDMNTILDELGNRWATLNKDELVALAQSVAGIRQYNQFMALMSNWDVMQRNVKLTKEANGALQALQEIYQKSTEAAQKRMEAAKEEFRTAIVGGKEIADTYNFLSNLIEGITKWFKALGGIKTLLLGVAAALTKLYLPLIASFISLAVVSFKNLKSAISNFSNGKGFLANNSFKADTTALAAKNAAETLPEGTAASSITKKLSELDVTRVLNEEKLNDIGKLRYDWARKELETKKQLILATELEIEKNRELILERSDNLVNQGYNSSDVDSLQGMAEQQGKIRAHGKIAESVATLAKDAGNLDQESRQAVNTEITELLNTMEQEAKDLGVNFDEVRQKLEEFTNTGKNVDELVQKIAELNAELEKASLKNIDTKIDAMADPSGAAIDKINGKNFGSTTTAGTTESILGQIDKKDLGGDKLTVSSNKKLLDSFKNEAAALKKRRSELLKLISLNKKLGKSIDSLTEELNENGAATKRLNSRVKEWGKNLEKSGKPVKKNKKDLKDLTNAIADNSEGATSNGEAIKNLGQNIDNLDDSVKKGLINTQHWSDSLVKGVSDIASYAMGLNMISSAFGNFGKILAGGKADLNDWISNIGSLTMGFAMMLTPMMSLSTGIKKVVLERWKDVAATIAEKKAQDAKINSDKKEKGSILSTMGARIKDILIKIKDFGIGIANIFKKGWPGIPEAVAALAGAAPFLLLAGVAISSAISGAKKEAKEAKDEQIEKDLDNNEAIKENQELAKSVSDLAKEYRNLRNSGQSTAEVLDQMKEKIPDLIKSYKDLGKELGKTIDTHNLEQAYDVFLKTGDLSLYEEELEKIDKEIAVRQLLILKNVVNNSKDLISDYAKSHIISNNTNSESEDRNTFYFKRSTGQIIDAYNQRLREGEEFSEETNKYMSNIIEAHQQLFEILLQKALKDLDEFEKNIASLDKTLIKTFEEYLAKRQQIIEELSRDKDMTEAEAKEYLSKSSYWGGFEQSADFFGEGGLARFNADAAENTIKEIQKWFASLPPEERTLAMNIDYTVIGNEADAKKALEKARELMRIAGAKEEAKNLGADDTVFEHYAESLTLTNKNLKNNRAAAYEVAAANYRVNKGLENLNKTWSDSIKKIRENTVGSYAYAEGIGEISKALKDMFGVAPSTAFISLHLNELQAIINGDYLAFEKLLNDLAKDFIDTQLRIEPEKVFSQEDEDVILLRADDVRNALLQTLNELDKIGNVEIGEQVTLSDKYLDTLQLAIDAGQITQQQLELAFKIKGYDLNFTTRTVPGPKIHYKREYKDGYIPEGFPKVIEWDETSDMTVPVLNGADAKVKATATKTVNASSLNRSTTNSNANKNKDKLKSLDKEKDRYHEIEKIIEDTERSLDRLSKAKDRAFGKSKLSMMDQEIKKQKELINNNKKLLAEAENYLEIDRNNLLNSWDIKLDTSGRITNYEEIQDRYIDRLKKAIGNDTFYENIEKEYNNFKDIVSQYETTLTKVKDLIETINDLLDELSSKRLEKIQYEVQLKIDATEDDKAYLDFLMLKIDDDAFKAADAINILGKEVQGTLNNINTYQEGINSVKLALENGEITEEDAIEQLKEYRNELIDANSDLLELRKTILDKLTEAFDAWNEKIEESAEKFEYLNSVIDHYKNIIDIVGKKNLGIDNATINALNQTRVDVAKDLLTASHARRLSLENTLQKYEEELKKAQENNDEESIKEWKELIKTVNETLTDAIQEDQENLETALEAVGEKFKSTTELIAETFSKAVSGVAGSLEHLREDWDREQEIAERYLSTYQLTYEVNKLNRLIEQELKKTDNVKSLKLLRDLLNEIYEKTKDGLKLSKNDLELLLKKHDLMIAELQLRDAQNAKSVVRLQRDSEGNFGYVYTADLNTTDQAYLNFEDKLYAYQQASDKINKEMAEGFIKTQEWVAEQVRNAAELYEEGTEEYFRYVDRIKQKAEEDLLYYGLEYEKLIGYNLDANARFNTGLATTYLETYLGRIAPDYKTFLGNIDSTTGLIDTAIEGLKKAFASYQTDVKDTLQTAGINANDFKTKVNGELGEILKESTKTSGAIKTMAGEMETGLGKAANTVSAFLNTYSLQMNAVWDSTNKVVQEVNSLINNYNGLASAAGIALEAERKYKEQLGKYNDTTGTSGSGIVPNGNKKAKTTYNEDAITATGNKSTEPGGSPGRIFASADERGSYGKYSLSQWYTYRAQDGTLYVSEDSNIWYSYKDIGKTGYVEKGYTQYHIGTNLLNGTKTEPKMHYYGKAAKDSDWFTNDSLQDLNHMTIDGLMWIQDTSGLWYKVSDLEKSKKKNSNATIYRIRQGETVGYKYYDTGGYTGEWGPEGRLAMLHQKELVLNAHDTENFLTAIGIVRDISDLIEKNAMVMKYNATIASAPAAAASSRDTLQQEVTIHAEFPNVTNHNEIEEAFRNLTNYASQYANRKF